MSDTAAATIPIPRSARTGIGWPAIPSYRDAAVLALVDQLEDSEWWPADRLLAYQIRQLENVIAHAARTVPFYRGRLRALDGLKKGELTLEAWRRLPVLRRAAVRRAGSRLMSLKLPDDHGDAVDVSTSGSTGEPVTVKATELTGLFLTALHLRYHRWHKRDLTATVANLVRLKGKEAELAKTGRAAPWAPVYGTGRMVSLDFRRPVSEQVEWLARQAPRCLLTYPSNLRAILAHGNATGFKPHGLVEVVTRSEVLDPDLRAACEADWGVKVTDSYSSEEVGLIAVQCPERPHYHIQSESVLLEVLDENGAACRPGGVGRVFVTDLHNFATPLIRYELGDFAEVGPACACGRGLPVLTRILGRGRNRLTLLSGEKTWPVPQTIEALGAAVPAVRQAQLVQRSRGEIDARIVAVRPLTKVEEAQAIEALRQYLGPDFVLRLVAVDEIRRSPSGKFEFFVSEIEA